MRQWTEIRQRVFCDGVSRRQIIRETGMHWKTLRKILSHGAPPGYANTQPRPKTKLGPYIDRIQQILEADKKAPAKQRHTAKRIYERLIEEGFTGKYTIVKDAVHELRLTTREVFVPLTHTPGEAQVDFFEAQVVMNGVQRKVHGFVMALPYSDAFFVACFERECTESFQEGHVRAFNYFGGVPRRISYDNSKIAVKTIIGVHERDLTDGFLQLVSHYSYRHHFCTVRRPNEKGVVEGTAKYARSNFMVPLPEVRDIDELNRRLQADCEGDMSRCVRGQGSVKSELLKEDQAHFLELPPVAFDACQKHATRVSSLSLVRFDRNDYSVPVRYGHHRVQVKGYVDRVLIFRDDALIAVHRRVWDKDQTIFEPRHYLALLERKPGALDYGRPFIELYLPDCFVILRRRMEAELGGKGTKEYIAVLLMLDKHSLTRLTQAVERALRVNAVSSDVIKLYLYPDERPESLTFRLDGRDHLVGVTVAKPDLTAYASVMPCGGF